MAKIPKALHKYINESLIHDTCLLGAMDPHGYPRITLRGSMCVYDDTTLAYWDRDQGEIAKVIKDGTKVCVYYRNNELRTTILPPVGVARFYGTAKVFRDGPVRDQVWDMILPLERERDPDRKGFAVLVSVEIAEDLRREPLKEYVEAAGS